MEPAGAERQRRGPKSELVERTNQSNRRGERKPVTKNGTLTEQQAKKIIGEILERTTGEPLHNYKVRDWLNHWLDMKEQVRASKTTARYRQVIRDFIASLGNSANLALAHITPKDDLTY
jgi:hypothetical protein